MPPVAAYIRGVVNCSFSGGGMAPGGAEPGPPGGGPSGNGTLLLKAGGGLSGGSSGDTARGDPSCGPPSYLSKGAHRRSVTEIGRNGSESEGGYVSHHPTTHNNSHSNNNNNNNNNKPGTQCTQDVRGTTGRTHAVITKPPPRGGPMHTSALRSVPLAALGASRAGHSAP